MSRKLNRCVTKVSIFLITMAVIAGMAGCGSILQCSLTISSTAGGNVTAPGEGSFTYKAGTVVGLNATPDAGYQFASWTGDAGTITDVSAAVTTIIMHSNYTITASFYEPEIWDWYDLGAIRNNPRGSYLLMDDLDSATPGYTELASPTTNEGKGWQPIGNDSYLFTGNFDGQGHEICDLFINRPDESLIGLFGSVGEEAVIENVGLVNATVTGEHEVGSLVGHNQGAVSSSYATSNVTGKGYYVGGLLGCINEGSVSNAYSTGNVTGYKGVGGLVGGGAYSTVSNSYSTGSVRGNLSVGGLVGFNFFFLTVSNSFWDIETSGQATSDGGTGKNTTEMQDIATFTGAGWSIAAIALNETNPSYIWNIVNNMTYPFLSWQLV